MIKKRSLLRAVAVLGVAFAAGHLVETMNAERQAGAEPGAKPATTESGALAKPAAAKVATADLPTGATLAAAPEAPVASAPPAAEPPPARPILAGLTGFGAAPDPAPAPLAEAEPAPLPQAADPVTPAKTCATDIGLAAGPNAMISLSLTAPCRAGERVVLRHAGLAVAEILGPDGNLTLELPALAASGEVSVLFADADVLRGAVPVPDVATLRRFVVQWMADDAFQLHGYENGAAYGTPGDVSAANPASPNGGSLVTLGNPALDLPMRAEVYTWPADGDSYAEPVVEAAVTEATCGRDLLGETILVNEGAVVVTDLTLSMPGCEAVGDILVLNNLVPDVTLAAVN